MTFQEYQKQMACLIAVHHLIQVVNNTIPTILNKWIDPVLNFGFFQFVSENRVKSRKFAI